MVREAFEIRTMEARLDWMKSFGFRRRHDGRAQLRRKLTAQSCDTAS
jgi:hypothetical protein